MHMAVLVINSTEAPAGISPPGGSSNRPHAVTLAFKAAVTAADVLFCTKPLNELFGQSTFRSERAMGCGPTRKRTISFCPSCELGQSVDEMQASTRMLSISKHLVGTWADTKLTSDNELQSERRREAVMVH